jgi:hypothetical protein
MARQNQHQQGFHALPVRESAQWLIAAQIEAVHQFVRVDVVPIGVNRTDEIDMPLQSLAAIQTHIVGRITDVPLRFDLPGRQPVAEHIHLAAIGMDQPHQDP